VRALKVAAVVLAILATMVTAPPVILSGLCIALGGDGCGYEAVNRTRGRLGWKPLPDWRVPCSIRYFESECRPEAGQ
jgi:hypothetical protein